MGSVPYDGGNILKDSYDPRTMMRSSVLPPQGQPIPPYNYQRPSLGKQAEAEKDRSAAATKPGPHSSIGAKVAPEVAINIDPNPFFMNRIGSSNKVESSEDRVVIDANFLQSKVQFGGVGAAHRKVGSVQYGSSRMY